MVMSMRLFSGKKRDAKKQQYASTNKEIEKSGDRTHEKGIRAPADAGVKAHSMKSGSKPVAAAASQKQPSRQQQPQANVQRVYMKGTNQMKPATSVQASRPSTLPSVAESPKRTQSPLPYKQAMPISTSSPALDIYYQQKKATQDTFRRSRSAERSRVVKVATSTPDNNRPISTPMKAPPRSILHTPHEHKCTQQPAFSMGTQEEVPAHNRVRFLSSNSSVASSSCASEVHLMAGCGSVASSSAMSSSRGDGAENVFDRVLHSVMTEEEDRLKAMGMSKAGSASTGLSPAMYYKTSESLGMYYRGGSRGSRSSDDDVSPTSRTAKPGTPKIPSARQLIDVDTGMEIDMSCESGNVECEYHDLNDDEAIDTRKYRNLLSQSSSSNPLNGSAASGASDRAINGSMNSLGRAPPVGERTRSGDLSPRQYQEPQTQYRKYRSPGSEF